MFSEARLSGVYTALVTPFSPDGSAVDTDALDGLVEAQIAGGVSGSSPSEPPANRPPCPKPNSASSFSERCRSPAGEFR